MFNFIEQTIPHKMPDE